MSGLKLIAIRPLEGCDKKYSKLLQIGLIYKFYNEFEFYNSNGKIIENNDDVFDIKYNKSIPENLYQINGSSNPININISAVVGKNGCGKSSLLELLYYSIYYLGHCVQLTNGEKLLKTYEDILEQEIQYITKYKLGQVNSIELQAELDSLYENQRDAKVNHDLILNGFKASVFYEYEHEFYELRINSPKPLVSKLNQINIVNKETKLSFDILTSIFYNISINYSHHSLNSNEIGSWINMLFHKNDGYKTPAVINPMRNNGNFDINEENTFAKQRLLSNLVIQYLNSGGGKKIYINENQHVCYLKFTYKNDNSISRYIQLKDNEYTAKSLLDAQLYEKLYSLYFEDYEQIDLHMNSFPFQEILANYTLQKVYKILKNYPEYNLIERPKDSIDVNIYAEKVAKILDDDKSHVVFKLKQALNFTRNNYIAGTKSKWSNQSEIVYFTFSEFCEWIGLKTGDEISSVFEKIPPTIFEVDFILSDSQNTITRELLPSFSDLSSGEKQFIHSIQSVLYHLNNIESIHYKSDLVSRITFDKINIIFDEIELYFHPELQRRFITNLLKNIELLNLKKINGINIIFATHSPFILSDIPCANVMKLMNGNTRPFNNQEQTLGANIHELLSDNFFMESPMGELITTKIKEIVSFYTKVINSNEFEIENLKREFMSKKIEFDFIANNVGEIVISSILKNHIAYIVETLEIENKYEKN